MESIYIKLDETSIACIDVSCFDYVAEENSWYINRVYVPHIHRGKGYGRKLLKECIEGADKEGAILWLEINPYGSLTYDELRAWYMRYGFEDLGNGIYWRPPRICTGGGQELKE